MLSENPQGKSPQVTATLKVLVSDELSDLSADHPDNSKRMAELEAEAREIIIQLKHVAEGRV